MSSPQFVPLLFRVESAPCVQNCMLLKQKTVGIWYPAQFTNSHDAQLRAKSFIETKFIPRNFCAKLSKRLSVFRPEQFEIHLRKFQQQKCLLPCKGKNKQTSSGDGWPLLPTCSVSCFVFCEGFCELFVELFCENLYVLVLFWFAKVFIVHVLCKEKL